MKANPNLPIRDHMMQFIIEYKQANDGVSPTVREIMLAVGSNSESHIIKHLNFLAGQGRLTYSGRRSIQVTGGQWSPPPPTV